MYNQALDDDLRQRVKPLLDHIANWIILLDAPDHGRIRRLINQAFTPRMLRGLVPRIEEVVDRLLEQTSQTNEPDFIHTFCLPLPAIVNRNCANQSPVQGAGD